MYTKFKKPQEKDLIYNNICSHLEEDFLPRKEDFYGVPDAKKELDKDNRRKQGKKTLFVRMNLTAWLEKDLDFAEYRPEVSVSETKSAGYPVSNSVTLTEPETVDTDEFIVSF